MPAIPDLRFEQGVLMSLRPFLHRPTGASTVEKVETAEEKEHAERVEVEETGAMVSSNFMEEDAGRKEASEVFLTGFGGAEWGQIAYVIFRDQVRFCREEERSYS